MPSPKGGGDASTLHSATRTALLLSLLAPAARRSGTPSVVATATIAALAGPGHSLAHVPRTVALFTRIARRQDLRRRDPGYGPVRRDRGAVYHPAQRRPARLRGLHRRRSTLSDRGPFASGPGPRPWPPYAPSAATSIPAASPSAAACPPAGRWLSPTVLLCRTGGLPDAT